LFGKRFGRSSIPVRERAAGMYYPGKKDHHNRVTTESTEIHGKENPNQLPLSVRAYSPLFPGFSGVFMENYIYAYE
jgi:hypothetical protein